ncbi:hypothetical protein U9M48_028384 [Paspalum notatum var. saurae]|uniref:Uncharacterized protein n=1 Tax=Paspalum notatum var. saurae TaxID=547442 RepID=A0AAQ3X1D3_PASNO
MEAERDVERGKEAGLGVLLKPARSGGLSQPSAGSACHVGARERERKDGGATVDRVHGPRVTDEWDRARMRSEKSMDRVYGATEEWDPRPLLSPRGTGDPKGEEYTLCPWDPSSVVPQAPAYFPCHKQPRGRGYIGYYVFEFLKVNGRNRTNPEDAPAIPLKDRSLNELDLMNKVGDLCRFTMHEVFNRQGNSSIMMIF